MCYVCLYMRVCICMYIYIYMHTHAYLRTSRALQQQAVQDTQVQRSHSRLRLDVVVRETADEINPDITTVRFMYMHLCICMYIYTCMHVYNTNMDVVVRETADEINPDVTTVRFM